MFRYFFWTTLVLLLCGGIFGFTITQLDPLSDISVVALSLFYSSLAGFVWSIMTYLFFFGAELSMGRTLKDYNFRVAMRRGLLVSIFTTGAVALQMYNMMGGVELLLFGVFLVLIELIFLEK